MIMSSSLSKDLKKKHNVRELNCSFGVHALRNRLLVRTIKLRVDGARYFIGSLHAHPQG